MYRSVYGVRKEQFLSTLFGIVYRCEVITRCVDLVRRTQIIFSPTRCRTFGFLAELGAQKGAQKGSGQRHCRRPPGHQLNMMNDRFQCGGAPIPRRARRRRYRDHWFRRPFPALYNAKGAIARRKMWKSPMMDGGGGSAPWWPKIDRQKRPRAPFSAHLGT